MYAQYFLRIEMHQVGSCQLGLLKHQKAIVTYLEVLKHQESRRWYFWRLNYIENVTREELTGRKRLKQNIAHVSRGKLKEPKFKWCV